MRQVQRKRSFVDLFRKIVQMTAIKTKMMPLFGILLGCFVIWPILDTEAAKPPPQVYINKCCRIGETLERNKECTYGGNEQWWPLIYMILKKGYFEPPGEAPRFFKVNESSRPICQSQELINGEHKVALFSNGTLYIPDRNEFIENDNFCIDKHMALICRQQSQNANSIDQPEKRTMVRKCCPKKAIYQTDKLCVTLSDGHEIIGRKLLKNTTMELDFRYAFPQCSKSTNDIAIVGKFNESDFDESSGNLTLTEGVFQSNQYCLEHLNDTGSVNVHVFTCSEYLPTSEKSGKVSQTMEFLFFFLFQ